MRIIFDDVVVLRFENDNGRSAIRSIRFGLKPILRQALSSLTPQRRC
jgi:hypothetical protein